MCPCEKQDETFHRLGYVPHYSVVLVIDLLKCLLLLGCAF